MNWLNNSIKFIKVNFNVLLISIYVISYTNYFIYYGSFNIDIISYVSLTDLLFYPLKLALGIFFTIILTEIILYNAFIFISIMIWSPYITIKFRFNRYLRRKKELRTRLKKNYYYKYNVHESDFKVFFAFIGFFACIFLKFDIKIILLPSLMVYIALLASFREKEYYTVTFIAIIVLLSTMFTTSILGVYKKRYVKDDFSISFIENNTSISTEKESSSINYLGQTSNYIFLYDIENGTSLIYSKSNISNIRIKENETYRIVLDFLRERINFLIGKSDD